MTGLYALGIILGIAVAFLFKSTLFKGEAVPFVMELPNYRMPGIKNVVQLLWEKSKDFLQKAFTVIFAATLIIWFLQTFSLNLNIVSDSKDSILAAISGLISPVLRPIGLDDWRICTSLITGVIAKESVVSTLTILFGTETAISSVLTTAQAASLLVFSLIYTPCIAALASIKRELGLKWAALILVWQCLLAWIAALVANGIFSLIAA